jgi:NAD dependent epimerase/dehydratase family enzyme
LVKLRTGIVLSNDGGALAEFKKPLKGFVAAILGDGKQVVSWIHMDDLCRMYLSAIENENINGAYNAVAPNPVTNKELVLNTCKENAW